MNVSSLSTKCRSFNLLPSRTRWLATGLALVIVVLCGQASPAKEAPDPWKAPAELLNSGKPEEALERYSKLVRQMPKDPRGYIGRGRALWRLQDHDGAIEAFDQAIALNPKEANAFNNRGLALEGKGELERARGDFDQAITLDPGSAAFRYNRAGLWTSLNEPEKAVADYDKAIELNPKFAQAYAKRGSLIAQPRPIRVNPALTAPGAVSDHTFRGRRAPTPGSRIGDLMQAMDDFAKAIELNPKYSPTYTARAAFWITREQYEKAIADASRSIELDSSDAQAFRIRSEARLALGGDRKLAEEDSQRALSLGSQTVKPVVRYRYENTVDLRADNTLNHVLVIGYDDTNIREATRLVVSAGGAPLTLRNKTDVNGAMYAPAVEVTKKGTLIIRWSAIDEVREEVELAADSAGNLTIVKRTQNVP